MSCPRRAASRNRWLPLGLLLRVTIIVTITVRQQLQLLPGTQQHHTALAPALELGLVCWAAVVIGLQPCCPHQARQSGPAELAVTAPAVAVVVAVRADMLQQDC